MDWAKGTSSCVQGRIDTAWIYGARPGMASAGTPQRLAPWIAVRDPVQTRKRFIHGARNVRFCGAAGRGLGAVRGDGLAKSVPQAIDPVLMQHGVPVAMLAIERWLRIGPIRAAFRRRAA